MYRSHVPLLNALAGAALSTVLATAQTPAPPAPVAPAIVIAPVPVAILQAKTIFVSNAGSDSGLFPEPFSGDPDRPYDQFYANLKATGKYELVNDPSQADLVLELQLTAPNGPSSGSKQKGAADPLPMFRLVVYDRKSHFVLWAITESIEVAYLQKTHDRNLDQSLTNVTNQFLFVAGKLPSPAIK